MFEKKLDVRYRTMGHDGLQEFAPSYSISFEFAIVCSAENIC